MAGQRPTTAAARQRRRRALVTLVATTALVAAGIGLAVALHRDGHSDQAPAAVDEVSPKAHNLAAKHRKPAVRPHQVDVPGAVGRLNATSCWFLPPTHGDRGIIVFLDPGHGGYDPGTEGQTSRGSTVLEKTATLAVAKDAAALLRARGFSVVLSRTTDSTVEHVTHKDLDGKLMTPAAVHSDIVDRVACANAAQSNVLVSIHFNSFPDPAVGGVDTHYDTSRPFRGDNKRLAHLVQRHVLKAFHRAGWAVPNRGIRNQNENNAPALTLQGDAYGHLFVLGPRKKGWNNHPSLMPGVLTEPLFLTRPTEADIAASPHGQRVIATALTAAITRYFAR